MSTYLRRDLRRPASPFCRFVDGDDEAFGEKVAENLKRLRQVPVVLRELGYTPDEGITDGLPIRSPAKFLEVIEVEDHVEM